MIQRIADSFLLRNLVICFLYVSPDMFQDIAALEQMGIPHLVTDVGGHIAFYMFFVFHNRVLYEKLFAAKKYALYLVGFFVTMFVWRESTQYLFWLYTRPAGETVYQIEELRNYNWLFWVFIYWADFVYSWFALGVYLAFKYFKERTRFLQVENLKKELELKQLNEQLNPHFLFNALNNIYSHLLDNTNDGKELILKLSELMRYILDSSKHTTVSLQDELKFIEHYIAFERERLGERCRVYYTKSVSAKDFNIVPLIMFNFIENAFKYGAASLSRSDIYIDIAADNDMLSLKVSNPVLNNSSASMQIGMDNTKKRLSLVYPDKYELRISGNEKEYTAILQLQNVNNA
ncbi:MAG: histidine kinase [Bacteroidetes bacterium]|nr:histidine kinase [Bacteroidota bacterium]